MKTSVRGSIFWYMYCNFHSSPMNLITW